MAPTIQELGIDQLSVDDRLAVAEAIWDSVAREVEAAPRSEPQRAELQRRLADSMAHPEAVTPWVVVKARALAKARRRLCPHGPGRKRTTHQAGPAAVGSRAEQASDGDGQP
ncbi:MAG: addiction module protein [Phycisphaeraceae bacterium]